MPDLLEDRLETYGTHLEKLIDENLPRATPGRRRAPDRRRVLVVPAVLLAVVGGGWAIMRGGDQETIIAVDGSPTFRDDQGPHSSEIASCVGAALATVERHEEQLQSANDAELVETLPDAPGVEALAFSHEHRPSLILVYLLAGDALYECLVVRDGPVIETGIGGLGPSDSSRPRLWSAAEQEAPGSGRYFGSVPSHIASITLELPDGTRTEGVITNGWFSIHTPLATTPSGGEAVLRWTASDGTEDSAPVDNLWSGDTTFPRDQRSRGAG